MANLYEMTEFLLSNTKRDPKEPISGKNISLMPEIKIICDGYADDSDTGEENANESIENYSMFIHKDALENGFVFPEHELARGQFIVNRPNVEVPIHAIHNVDEGYWDINFWEELPNGAQYNSEHMESIIEGLYAKYHKESGVTGQKSPAWPFGPKDPPKV